MLAEAGYRGYGPTYRSTYNILYGEFATGEPFRLRRLKTSVSTPFSAQVYLTTGLRRNA